MRHPSFLLVEVFGLRFQAEYVRALVTFSKRGIRLQERGPGYQPDHTKQGIYTLLAYKLPLEKWLGDMTLSPFVFFEHSNMDNTTDVALGHTYGGGFNFKPSPFVVLKLEYVCLFMYKSHQLQFHGPALQMAVSF